MEETLDIKPLKHSTNKKGGRPTRYRKTLPDEINAYLDENACPHNVIEKLGTSMEELKRWKRRPGMNGVVSRLQKLINDKNRKIIKLSDVNEDDDYEGQLSQAIVEAMRTLRLIMRTGTSDSAKVQAAKEILDRAKGKPVQTTQVNQNVSYTIHAAIPAPPNSAALEAQAIEADCETIDE